jgi:phage terminase large subunit
MTDIRLNPLEIVQESYWDVLRSKSLDLIVYGGNNAGKSYAIARKLLLKALAHPNRRIVIIRKRTPSLKVTCWTWMLELLDTYGLKPYVKINHTELTIEYENGSHMLFVPVVTTGGEPGERLKSLTDVTDLWIEEATELTRPEWDQVKLRVRGKLDESYRQRILTFNPYDRRHWIHKVFFEGNVGEHFLRTWRDNKYADQQSIDDIEAFKTTDPYRYAVASLGEWGIFENQIYSRITTEAFSYQPEYYDEFIGGCDWGFESPSAFILIGLKEKKAYIIAEIYERQLLQSELAKKIDKLLKEYLPVEKLEIPIYVDPSMPSLLEEMERAGLYVMPGDKSVLDGINTVKEYDLIIHDLCKESQNELYGYRRQVDRNGEVREEPLK